MFARYIYIFYDRRSRNRERAWKTNLNRAFSKRSAETHLVSYNDQKWQISFSQLIASSESVNVFFLLAFKPPLLYFQNVGISQTQQKKRAQNKGPFQSTRDVTAKGFAFDVQWHCEPSGLWIRSSQKAGVKRNWKSLRFN